MARAKSDSDQEMEDAQTTSKQKQQYQEEPSDEEEQAADDEEGDEEEFEIEQILDARHGMFADVRVLSSRVIELAFWTRRDLTASLKTDIGRVFRVG